MGQIEKYRFCQGRKSENKTMNLSKKLRSMVIFMNIQGEVGENLSNF